MTTDEFAYFAAALKTYFPRENLLPSDTAMELWYKQLADMQYQIATAALDKWVATEKWPPSIADMRRISAEIENGAPMDWGLGWAEVEKAIGRWGIYREKEALASMSPATRSAVERIGWRSICMSENADTLRAQFRQVFEVCSRRQTENQQLPAHLKSFLNASGMKMLDD